MSIYLYTFFRLLLVLILVITSSTAQAGLEEGINAYRSGNYTLALSEFTPLAAKGDAAAQFDLGVMNERGQGLTQNYQEALSLYRQAAEQGYVKAQLTLGVLYSKGQEIPKDEKESVLWFTKAAEQGNALAQFNLGVMYANGQGVTQDDKLAAMWFGKSAEQGDAVAELNLGVIYAKGKGVEQDYATAFKWYEKSAGQDNKLAQLNLGLMYAKGMGVKQDLVQADKWFNLVGNAAGEDPIKIRKIIEEKMTPKEIETAEMQAHEWNEKLSGSHVAKVSEEDSDAQRRSLESFIRSWAKAWESHQVDKYLEDYSQKFVPPNDMTRQAWESSRRERINKAKNLEITLDDIKFPRLESTQAEAVFRQSYKSTTLVEQSRKKLSLEYAAGHWLITTEESEVLPKHH